MWKGIPELSFRRWRFIWLLLLVGGPPLSFADTVNPADITLTSGLTGTAPIMNFGSILIIPDPLRPGQSMMSASESGAVLSNFGTMITSESYGSGMEGGYPNTTLINAGTIITGGFAGFGFDVRAPNSIAQNSGIIQTTGDASNAFFTPMHHVDFLNSGSIVINAPEHGGAARFLSSNINIVNTGSILVNAPAIQAYGVFIEGGNDNLIQNTGNISVIGLGDRTHGIYVNGGNFNSIENQGNIVVSGLDNNTHGVYINGNDNTVTNSGSLVTYTDVLGSEGDAITFLGENNTLSLLPKSLIVGNLNSNSNTNILNIDMGGVGSSYAFTTTGSWTVQDLEQRRPMVKGSAYAAGIGLQEAAPQLLYQRIAPITTAIDRRVQMVTGAHQKTTTGSPWMESYYTSSIRDAATVASSVRTHFSNYSYGVIGGLTLPSEMTALEFVLNFEEGALNIDNASQQITGAGVMGGVIAPEIIDIFGMNLSAKVLAGWGSHNAKRIVFTNDANFNGVRTVTADYLSGYGVFGAALTQHYDFWHYFSADALLGVDFTGEHVQSYSESAYYSWNQRMLQQWQSRAELGLEAKFFDSAWKLFGRAGVEHRKLISGHNQNYQMNGTGVSFDGGDTHDSYLTAQFGTTYRLSKQTVLFGGLQTNASVNTVRTMQANLGIRADF